LSIDLPGEWLRRQIREFNKDIPRVKLPLSLLLEMDIPYVETVGGERHYFDKKELRELSEMLPRELLDKFRLPLVFKRSLEVGESLYLLDGGEVEVEVLKKLVGLTYIPSRGRQYYTYKPIISKLISKFPSIVVIGII